MPASLIARLASLLLVLALWVPSAPAAAAGRTPNRGVSKGRTTLHRPNYKQYNANSTRWFFQRW